MVELEYVWTAEALQGRLSEALQAVQELDPPPDLRVPTFNLAAQALMLQVPKQQAGGVAVPGLGVLPGVRGH